VSTSSSRTPVRPDGKRRTATGGGGAGRRRLVMALAAVGVIGFAVAIAVLSVEEAGSVLSVDDVAGPVTVTGDRLPAVAPDTQDPFVGELVPVAEGIDFDGAPVTIGGTGRPQVVLFLASWCPVCQEELPLVVDFIAEGGVPADVELVAVVTGLAADRPNWPPQAWLEREGYDGVVIRDDANSTIASTYGMTGTPFWMVVDADGRLVQRVSGLLPKEQFPVVFRAALAGS
jgi:thiol-disulfide isomerase/thioredoxin